MLSRPLQQLLQNLTPVPGGRFTRGSDHGQAPEYDYGPYVDRICDYHLPIHDVQLSNFQISKYPITQAQWQAVMGHHPSHFTGCARCPVEQVSWNDCQLFLEKLNAMTGRRFNLPTEAQWEYAARGGQAGATHYASYAGGEELDAVAWHEGNAGRKTHPVGTKVPNALGLYDMSGNVWEWCRDTFNMWYYREFQDKMAVDPQGPPTDVWKVIRGGAWCGEPIDYRVDYKFYAHEDGRKWDLGFRVVMDAVD